MKGNSCSGWIHELCDSDDLSGRVPAAAVCSDVNFLKAPWVQLKLGFIWTLLLRASDDPAQSLQNLLQGSEAPLSL